MTRFIMFVFIIVLSIFSLFGCGATLHQTRSSGFARVEDEPPVVTASRHREHVAIAESDVSATCERSRIRGLRTGGVSTRDGMRVYCF